MIKLEHIMINIENYEYIFGMYRIDDNFQNSNGKNDNIFRTVMVRTTIFLEVTEIKL